MWFNFILNSKPNDYVSLVFALYKYYIYNTFILKNIKKMTAQHLTAQAPLKCSMAALDPPNAFQNIDYQVSQCKGTVCTTNSILMCACIQRPQNIIKTNIHIQRERVSEKDRLICLLKTTCTRVAENEHESNNKPQNICHRYIHIEREREKELQIKHV